MLCEVRSLGLTGISGYEVRAECDLSGGLPALHRYVYYSTLCAVCQQARRARGIVIESFWQNTRFSLTVGHFR